MKKILDRLTQFRDDRQWRKFHTEMEISRALMVEAAEVNELYLWGQTPTKERLSEEVADVMIYALNLCLIANFDPIAIINQKIDKNAVKYPKP